MSEKEVLRDFTELGKRFTFAVCRVCGIQSPPIILGEFKSLQPLQFEHSLKKMGWSLDQCPNCLKVEGNVDRSVTV